MNPFLDTNLLVYAQGETAYGTIARSLIERGGTISVQILNEFASVARRKLGYSMVEVDNALRDIRQSLQPVRSLTLEIHLAAVAIASDHSLNFYDALVVASAIEAGCDTLLTEDMQHGRILGPLTIHNPCIRP